MNSSVSIRLNPFKEASTFQGTTIPWNKYARLLDYRPNFTLDPLFHAGCYYVQDTSAMYVGHIFRKFLCKKSLKVLDLCAAPGGKTTDLATSLREVYGSDFLLVSNEVMKARARVLFDNVQTWGDPNVIVTNLDPAAFKAFEGYFDIIVADVPCSGEGMFRKDAKAVEQWSEDTVKLCASRQKRILADIWPALKTGGILIYSTCTYNRSENDDNLLWTAEELGAEIIKPQDEFSSFGVEITECGHLLRAGIVPGEGQWVGAAIKTASCAKSKYNDISILRPLTGDRTELENPLSIDFDNKYPRIEVDKPTALKYLHRDSLVFKDAPLGINVITYQNHPLGYVKNIGSRCNNLLPKGRRIMMDV